MEIEIIHICEDEKFINSAIEQFETCFPERNTFYILQSLEKKEFVYVKPQKCVHKCTKQELIEIAKTIEKNVLVVLNSLSPQFYEFVLTLPKENQIVWFCFGYEVYNDINYFKSKYLLDRHTYIKFPDYQLPLKKRLKEQLRPYYRLVKKKLPLSRIECKKQVIKRIDYLGSPFFEDFSLISKLTLQKKMFFEFWYYPLELILDVNSSIKANKKFLLIGNSGHKSGNHLDVFEKIKLYELVVDEIVIPLNYGDPNYIEVIKTVGEKYFLEKFRPLLEFMPLHEYNQILEGVGIAILNNKRQQAVGNTIALLWMGAKVFLSNQNTFYQYLKRIGIIVYCYETELNEKSCNQFLTLPQIEHNRKLLFDSLNQEKLSSELKSQILKIYE